MAGPLRHILHALGWWEWLEVYVPQVYPISLALTGYSTRHRIPYDARRGVIPKGWEGYPLYHRWLRAKPDVPAKGGK